MIKKLVKLVCVFLAYKYVKTLLDNVCDDLDSIGKSK